MKKKGVVRNVEEVTNIVLNLKKKTNYSYIRDMSVEEMALFMDKMQLRCLSESCKDCPLHKINPLPHYYCSVKDIKEWLESEVDMQE